MSAPEAPEVSWKAIEEGAEVVSAEGEAVAKVSMVVGDPNADIFTGLAVATGSLAADRFVAAERVTHIRPGRVEVDLTAAELERLPEYVETPTVQWRPGRAGLRSALRRFLGR